MEGVLEANENSIIFGTLVGAFFIAAAWEAIWPRRKVSANLRRRWTGNIALTLTSQVLIYWLDVAVTIGVAWLVASSDFGLFSGDGVNPFVAFGVTLLALELTTYIVHRAMHQVPWLWRIHCVHHSDTELDFTTTGRNHPLELLVVLAASVPVIVLLAPPVYVVVLYQIGRTSVVILAHSNVYIPEWIDRWLRYLIITPDYHRMHHSDERRYTDSNYAAFVPWFDYLFGTATRVPFDEQPSMRVGLEYFRDPAESDFSRLLTMPFRSPDTGRSPSSTPAKETSTLAP